LERKKIYHKRGKGRVCLYWAFGIWRVTYKIGKAGFHTVKTIHENLSWIVTPLHVNIKGGLRGQKEGGYLWGELKMWRPQIETPQIENRDA